MTATSRPVTTADKCRAVAKAIDAHPTNLTVPSRNVLRHGRLGPIPPGRTTRKPPGSSVWTSRDTSTGRFASVRASGGPYKAVKRESGRVSTGWHRPGLWARLRAAWAAFRTPLGLCSRCDGLHATYLCPEVWAETKARRP